MKPTTSPERTTAPSDLLETQRLTIGDLVVFTRKAADPKASTNVRIALANMRQNRHQRALQIRKSFRLLPGGKPSA